jgi:hypothetical protein
MATQHKSVTHEPTVAPEFIHEAPVAPKDLPDPTTWQGGFITVATELDALGWQWLGNIFRDVGNPPVQPTKAHGNKAGK